MMEMIMGGDSYEKSCWKWSGMHSVTTEWAWEVTMVIIRVILRVILRVVYVFLMMEMVMGGDSYEKCCWKYSTVGPLTSPWGITMVILGVI